MGTIHFDDRQKDFCFNTHPRRTFLERKEEKEKHQSVAFPIYHDPINPRPTHMHRLGIERATFWCRDDAPTTNQAIQLSQPARARLFFLDEKEISKSFLFWNSLSNHFM